MAIKKSTRGRDALRRSQEWARFAGHGRENEACTKEKDLYGHVQRDADQRDEESCKHGKTILISSTGWLRLT